MGDPPPVDINEPTYYFWKIKYANMEVSQLRHLKDVETELARLKRMYPKGINMRIWRWSITH